MHEIDVQTFSDKVPGSSPTTADRAKFFKPSITKKNTSEHAIGIELTKTIKSVFQAAASHGLRVLHSPPHKLKGCLDQMSDAFNRVGIYLDAETAQRATTLIATDGANKELIREQVESGDFHSHSWRWMAVLGVVKSFHNPECAFYMGHASSMTSSDPFSEVKDSQSEASDDDIEAVQSPSLLDARLEGTDDEDGSSVTSLDDDDDDDDDDEPYTRRTRTKESAISELPDFMYNLATCQHRIFAYGFYVQWRWARLLYFDRSGVLVSEPFDWTEVSSPLHDFVWKFAHMTPEECGYDPTAREASYDEIAEVFTAARSESLPAAIQPYIQRAFPSSNKLADRSEIDGLKWDADEPSIYKLTVTSLPPSPDDVFPDSAPPQTADALDTSERTFLVGRPQFVAESLVGRCTRGYIAWVLEFTPGGSDDGNMDDD